jgi:hypothetical protein
VSSGRFARIGQSAEAANNFVLVVYISFKQP